MLPETGEFRKAKFNVLSQPRNRLPAKFMYVAAPIAPIHRILGAALGRSTGFALLVRLAHAGWELLIRRCPLVKS